jgi:dTDP-4-amino-4,6-dideoxygalactose transaminase
MQVPFVDLSRLVARVRGDVLAAWADCLDAGSFVGGPGVTALETKLAVALGVPRVVACANGTDALIVALQTAGVRRGMKVALPNLTFWATFEAVAQLGAVPVLIDVDPDDLQMSLGELRSANDAHGIDAAVFVHLYGWTSARLRELRSFCKERAIALVEDGAQSFGVEAFGEPLLAGAESATLSFYPAKVVGGAMDGGAVTMHDEEREKTVRSLCNHGRADHYSYAHVGWNSRMGGLQAAFLSRVLDELPAILRSRRETAAFYRERLREDARIRVYGPPCGVVENGYLNVLTVEGWSGASVANALEAAGIGAARTYPEPLDAQPPARAAGAIAHGELRCSRQFCERVVNLPLFFGIREDEREAAARALLGAVRYARGP